jgi:hypothetical protein
MARDLPGLLEVKLPPSCAASFMHEFTHHWCLYTPVGAALSLLHLRAFRRAIIANARVSSGEDPESEPLQDEIWAVLDDYVRYDSTVAMLRPLFEGLAVFGEADVLPGDSPISSNLLHWLAIAFARDYKDPDATTMDDAVRRFLFGHRLSAAYLHRKESLLAEPLEDVRRGYLASYLFLKDMWTGAVSADQRFLDSDLFLCAVKAYFCDDLGFVAHILDDGTRDLGAGIAISQYFAARLRSLARGGFAHLADPVIANALATPAYYTVATPERQFDAGFDEQPLDTAQDLRISGRDRLEAIWTELDDEATHGDIARSNLWLFATREMMSIGGSEVTVEIDEHDHLVCRHGERPVLAGPVDAASVGQVGVGHHSGYLNGYLFPYQGFVGIAVIVEDVAVLTKCTQGASELMEQQFRSMVRDVSEYERLTDEMRAFIEEFVDGDESIGGVLDVIRARTEEWYQEQFVGQVLAGIPAHERSSRVQDMGIAGFGSALGGRGPLRALTWLSLLATFKPNVDSAEVQEVFERDRWFHGHDGQVTDCIAQIQRIGMEKLNESLIIRLNATIYSVV